MDVDGYPGGALWRSDNNGRSDSWRDATPAIAASLPQVRIAAGVLLCVLTLMHVSGCVLLAAFELTV